MMQPFITAGLVLALAACVSPIRSYNGYSPDEIHPSDVQPGRDTRASVLARLGSASSESVFNEDIWFYVTTRREHIAFMIPETKIREITAVHFGADGRVEDVLTYDETAGKVILYASRETPTLGRQLSFMEQLFGSMGTVLPNTDERAPGDAPGRNRP